MQHVTTLLKALSVGGLVTTLAACGTSGPANVGTLIDIAGHSVPGAQGKTLDDQERIDDHVARMCGAKLYARVLCDAHTKASAQRRRELTQESAPNVVTNTERTS